MTANIVSASGGTAVAQLLEVLDVQEDGSGRFTGSSPDPDAVRIFGGQIAAQAAVAAARRVPGERRLASLQGSFLRMGDASRPVSFEVEAVGDGRSFSFRRILAHQGDRLIFTAVASFHAGGEGPAHEVPHRAPVRPEDLPLWEPEMPVLMTHAFELRRGLDAVAGAGRGMDLAVRTLAPLPDDPAVHAALAVYVSDLFILDASLLPHQDGEPDAVGDYSVATVDFAIRLHAPVRLDRWVVNRFECPRAGSGLSEVRCETRTEDGALVASGTQLGVLGYTRRG